MKTLKTLILTDFDAARPIIEAWAQGEILEWLHSGTGNWHNATRSIELNAVYRIPPRPHTVDWLQVGERVEAFETTPHGEFVATRIAGSHIPADVFPSFRPGTMPWQESRVERPKEVK